MKASKYLFFFAILITSCNEKICDIPQVESITHLNSEENILQLYKDNDKVIFENGNIEYDSLEITKSIEVDKCLHSYECSNTGNNLTYTERAPVATYKLVSEWIEITITISPQRDYKNIELFHEELNLLVRDVDHTCVVLDLIADNQNNPSLEQNTDLTYYESIVLNGKTYNDVYTTKTSEYPHKIYFNFDMGVVGFYRSIDQKLFNLQF